MLAPIVLCALCLADAPPPGPASAPGEGVLAEYREARSRAGRDAAAHVRLALWCEQKGLTSERLRHLALAVLHDPSHAAARGLMGLVEYRGKWQGPEAVADQVKADAQAAERLAEYNRRRARLEDTAEGHWTLALWCEQNGLRPEAVAHLTNVVRLDPSREAAWKRLGCKKHKGRWLTEAQIAAEKADAEAQKKANKAWPDKLRKWREALADPRKRDEAEAALAGVTDPRAVPAIWAVFAAGGERDQAKAVELLGQVDGGSASRALAALAVFSESAEVRRRATETLRRRDGREYLGTLIALFRDQLKYEVRPVGGPGSPGALFVQGKQLNVQRVYEAPPLPSFQLFPGEPVFLDELGLPVVTRMTGFSTETQSSNSTLSAAQVLGTAAVDPGQADMVAAARQQARFAPTEQTWFRSGTVFGSQRFRIGVEDQAAFVNRTTTTTFGNQTQIPIGKIVLEHQKAAVASQERLAADVRMIEALNRDTKAANERLALTLQNLTGVDHGEDREAWARWWLDEQGYAYTPAPERERPTVVEPVPSPYQPQPVATVTTRGPELGSQTTYSTSVAVSPAFVQGMASQGFVQSHNCFGAGTPVRTIDGLRPIETLRVGDRVLTQDPATGTLEFQPIVAVYHNRPSATLRLDLGGETIVATLIHRFWKAGHGWTMARDLEVGDRVRTLGGSATVASVESDAVQPVFNLEVARGGSFLVGRAGALVHDNSLVLPVAAPFDAAAAIAAK